MIVGSAINLLNIIYILIRNVIYLFTGIIKIFIENQRCYVLRRSEYNMDDIKEEIRETIFKNKEILNRWPLIFVMISDKEYEKDIWNEYERTKRSGYTFNGLRGDQKMNFIKLCLTYGYENILIKIMEEKNWWIDDYYEFYSYINEIDNDKIREVIMSNDNFKNHVVRYNRKYEKRLNKESIEIKRIENDNKDECVICLEEIMGYYIECKNCKMKIDNKCFTSYLFKNNYNNNCCLCRNKMYNNLSKESLKKYLEYKEIE